MRAHHGHLGHLGGLPAGDEGLLQALPEDLLQGHGLGVVLHVAAQGGRQPGQLRLREALPPGSEGLNTISQSFSQYLKKGL